MTIEEQQIEMDMKSKLDSWISNNDYSDENLPQAFRDAFYEGIVYGLSMAKTCCLDLENKVESLF